MQTRKEHISADAFGICILVSIHVRLSVRYHNSEEQVKIKVTLQLTVSLYVKVLSPFRDL
jgi:hypothetical protein